MTGVLRDWDPPAERQGPPPLAIYEPGHGPIWVATLPNWRNRALVGSAAAVAVAIVGALIRSLGVAGVRRPLQGDRPRCILPT